MKVYMKQKVFSWGDKFSIYDASGKEVYYVQGEIFSFGKKLHIYGLDGRELAFIGQQLLTFLPKYTIYRGGCEVAEVIKEFTLFKQKYSVEGFGWQVEGDFWQHEYEITDGYRSVVSVSKEWMTWGDSYEIEVKDGVDEINALATVLVIDSCIEASQRNNN